MRRLGNHGLSFKRPCRALTLAEVAASLSIAGVLLGSLASTVVVASKALPAQNTTADSAVQATAAIDRMNEELQCAVAVSVRTPQVVEFTIPDRTGDSVAETIRYEWSGVAGDPLTRQYNGGNAAAVVGTIKSLALTYDLDSRTRNETTTTYVDSAETVLGSFTSFGGIYTTNNLAVTNTAWGAEAFTTLNILPADITQLRLTRVVVSMRRASGANLATTVSAEIRPINMLTLAIGATPIGTPVSKSVSTLSTSYANVTFNFSDVTITNPLQSLAVLFKGSASPAAQLQQQSSLLNIVNDTTSIWTTNSGSSWQPGLALLSQYDIPFTAYGIYTTKVVSQAAVTHYYLKRVRALMKLTGSGLPIASAAAVVNEPEVSP